MRKIHLPDVTRWITEAAVQHGQALPGHVAGRLGVAPASARKALARLVDLQWLKTDRSQRPHRYSPGPLRQVVKTYALTGLQEDLPWRRDFAPCLALPPEVARMARHAFTELLNNAAQHSGGSAVTVSMRQTPLQLQLLVSDDGCGLFDRVARAFDIHDPQAAMLELSKGLLSSDPDRHSGRGLFFSAQLADVFDIHANAAAFQRRSWETATWHSAKPAGKAGTTVYLALALDTQRTLDGVLRAHSLSGHDYGFERTRVHLQLLAHEKALASRAEAQRAVARLAQFRRAEIDFSGIDHIGHGFADELFRVFGRQHPGVELVPLHMGASVAAMVRSIGC